MHSVVFDCKRTTLRCLFLVISLFGTIELAPVSLNGETIRALSDGWYRVPYADSTKVRVSSSNTLFNNGHNGYDLTGRPLKAWNDPALYRIVAAADGIVRRVIDSFNQCSNNTDCQNSIWIEHPNGEFTAYFHIAFNSAQVDSGDCVVEGQWIASEGDVGRTTSTDSILNRPKVGCDGMEDHSDDSCNVGGMWIPCGFCGVHLHWAVTRYLGSMNPDTSALHAQICNTGSHVLPAGDVIDSADVGPCDNSACIGFTLVIGSWTNTIRVIEVDDSLRTGGDVVVTNSVLGFQAGERISLMPGFKASSGCYFRARIAACNTGASGCPD